MGEIVSPCGQNPGTPPSATCTIQYQSGGAWQNGANSSCSGAFYSEYNQQNALEGINLNDTGCTQTSSSQGQFRSPLAIAPSSPCTADSHGYCAVLMNQGTGKCGTPRIGFDTYPTFETFDIFKQGAMLELQESATETNKITDLRSCNYTTSWSPAAPSVTFNDPSLP